MTLLIKLARHLTKFSLTSAFELKVPSLPAFFIVLIWARRVSPSDLWLHYSQCRWGPHENPSWDLTGFVVRSQCSATCLSKSHRMCCSQRHKCPKHLISKLIVFFPLHGERSVLVFRFLCSPVSLKTFTFLAFFFFNLQFIIPIFFILSVKHLSR